MGALLRSLSLYVLAARWGAVWILPSAFAAHVLIEALVRRDRETLGRFALRQAAYLVLVIGIWMGLVGFALTDIGHALRNVMRLPAFWIVSVAFLVAVWPAGQVIGLFTEPWRKRILEKPRPGLEKAGLWIGRLERVLILTSILIGHYELIGFLVAVKSILRFADIRGAESHQEAEYILVGTMLSFTLAVGVGVVARLLLHRFTSLPA